MKKARTLLKTVLQERKANTTPLDSLVFFDRVTGAAQFRAADAGLECTVEQMAIMLAMQCLVRGSEPSDFAILVPANKQLADRLVSRAKRLLDEGRAAAGPACLSPRQREILHAVIGNRSNKEIASNLNITVRTVKFHVSSLLNKFRVGNRGELARRAVGFFRPTALVGECIGEKRPALVEHGSMGTVPDRATLQAPDHGRRASLPERFLSA